MNKLFYVFVFSLFVYLSNSIILELPLTKGGDGSTVLEYPPSTSGSSCSFQIPILFKKESSDTFTQFFGKVDIGSLQLISSSDSSWYTLFSHSLSTTTGSAIVTISFYLSDLTTIYKSFTLNLNCNEFKLPFSYKIVDYGIFYNTLAFKIQIDSLEVDKDIALDFNTSVLYTQSYNGDRTFFISFKNNIGLFFNDAIIPLRLLLGSSSFYDLSIPSPFKNFNQHLSFSSMKAYPETFSATPNFCYPVLELTSSSFMDSYFSINTSLNEIINEPFLISGSSVTGIGTYLASFKSSGQKIFNVYSFNTNIFQSLDYTLSDFKGSTIISGTIDLSLDNKYYTYYIPLAGYDDDRNIPVYFGSPLRYYSYPFGFLSVLNFQLDYSFISSESNLNKNLIVVQKYGINYDSLFTQSFDLKDPSIPSNVSVNVIDHQAELLPNNRLLLKFQIYCQVTIRSVTIYGLNDTVYDIFPFSSISTDSNFLHDIAHTVEINIPRMNILKYAFTNVYYQDTIYYTGLNYYYFSSDKVINFKNILNLDSDLLSKFPQKELVSVSFLFNDIKVTNVRVSNKMYVKINNYPIDKELKVTFIWSDYIENPKKETVYSYYNTSSQQFEFEFIVPKNIKNGNVSYIISLDSLDKVNYYSYSLPSEYQLRVSESKNIDIFGPIITKIETITQSGYGWYLNISDSSNGFKSGWINIVGSLDRTERKFIINSSNRVSGDQFNGVYEIKFNVTCLTQDHLLVYGFFEDTEGYSNEFKSKDLNLQPSTYKLYSSEYIYLTYVTATSTCNTPDNQKPLLNRFFITSQVFYNNSAELRTVTVNYVVSHPDGISTDFSPMLFASAYDFKFLNSSNTKVISTTNTTATFQTDMLLTPYFGLNQDGISFSVYGIVTKRGINAGFILGKTTTTSYGSNLIIISDSSKFSSTGMGGVWLYGQYLNLATEFKIQYNDNKEGYISISANNVSGSTAFLSNIRATNKPIQVIAGNSNGYSEPITIYPQIFDFIDQGYPSKDSSLCKGSPLCGGSSKGKCYTTGCKCISPWVGDDCLSQFIKVPPPSIDETSPSTNITIKNEIQFTSIVSIVGIRELSITSKEENRYIFDKWEYKLLVNDSNSVKYSYISEIKKDNVAVSNISAILEFYKNPTTVYFANNQIDLNPSTIKYTIEIGSYPFSTKLNTLQLIFKTSIHSNNSDSCSDKQSGLQDNLDTFKLQVRDHSFYGRFAQRGIIDNDNVIKVTNELLDPSLLGFKNENNHQISQSFIGVLIPNYVSNVIYDPDFSVLLNSNLANSNCKNSGLTASQLAGIIVGSVALFIIILVIVSVIIYKSPGCLNVKIMIYRIFKKSKI